MVETGTFVKEGDRETFWGDRDTCRWPRDTCRGEAGTPVEGKRHLWSGEEDSTFEAWQTLQVEAVQVRVGIAWQPCLLWQALLGEHVGLLRQI